MPSMVIGLLFKFISLAFFGWLGYIFYQDAKKTREGLWPRRDNVEPNPESTVEITSASAEKETQTSPK